MTIKKLTCAQCPHKERAGGCHHDTLEACVKAGASLEQIKDCFFWSYQRRAKVIHHLRLWQLICWDISTNPAHDDFGQWWLTDRAYISQQVGTCQLERWLEALTQRGLIRYSHQLPGVSVYILPWLIKAAQYMGHNIKSP